MPFLLPAPSLIQLRLIIQPDQSRRQVLRQGLGSGPCRKETAAQNGIKHRRVPREIPREPRCRRANIDDQIHQGWVRLEQRKKLHARGQAAQESIEIAKRLFRACRLGKPGQKIRAEPGKDLLSPGGAERRIPMPALNNIAGRLAQLGFWISARIGRKERLGQMIHGLQPALQRIPEQIRLGHTAEPRQPVKPFFRIRQTVGLRIGNHLKPMLHLPMGAVMRAQSLGGGGLDPAFPGQRLKCDRRLPASQIRVTPARHQLPGLRKKLDLADAPGTKLHIMAVQGDRPMQPLMRPDPLSHIMGVLDRREIQMFAPNEGRQDVQEPRARRDIARRRAGFDIGAALPTAPLGLVIALRRRHRDANRCRSCIWAQAQIGAEHIAFSGVFRQRRRHPPRRADKTGPDIHLVGRVEPAFIEQADQVDIRGIVQLPRTHFAHRQRHHPGTGFRILRHHPWQLAAFDLGSDMGPHRNVNSGIRKIGQRACDLFQAPDPAQIR